MFTFKIIVHKVFVNSKFKIYCKKPQKIRASRHLWTCGGNQGGVGGVKHNSNNTQLKHDCPLSESAPSLSPCFVPAILDHPILYILLVPSSSI